MRLDRDMDMANPLGFEQGPIRPPSEATSLLIRTTRNCPWNKCTFCYSYHHAKFSLRTVEEIKEDILAIKKIADGIREFSWQQGHGGQVDYPVIQLILNSHHFSDYDRSVAVWLYYGGTSVFLQDANTIIMKTDQLVEVIRFLKTIFPAIERITSYGRSITAAKKTVEEFSRLKEAGLSRIHVGMESGYDPILDFIKKGETAADHIEGGKRIVAGGISLSEYIMPGLGGIKWTKEHAQATADVLNEINPHYIRLRSLQVRENTSLYAMMQEGLFVPLGDEDVVRELQILLEKLNCTSTYIVSDHILNLLEEIEGHLPEDKAKMLAVVHRFLDLSHQDKMIYRLGRRQGIYRCLDDLSHRDMYERLKRTVEEYDRKAPGQLDKDLFRIMHGYI